MPAWLQMILHLITALMSAWATRNASVVGFGDWQTLLPAAGAGISASAQGLWSLFGRFFSKDQLPATLQLVAKLIPYREQMLPQEVRDAVFNAMRWRFAKHSEAVSMIDKLVVIDMQLAAPNAQTAPATEAK